MNYSSAWFEGDRGATWSTAQHAKVRRALAECGVAAARACSRSAAAGARWPKCAARDFGAHVTGVTLSREQLAWAQQRLHDAGAARGDLRLQDYRDIAASTTAPFDADRLDRDVRGRRARILGRATSTTLQALSQAGRPRLHPEHHDPRRPVRALREVDRLHPAVHLPRRPAAQPAAPSAARPRRLGLQRRQRTRPSASTTPRHCAAGACAFLGREQASARARLRRPASCASGSSTSAYCEAAFAPGNTDVMQFTLRRD